MSAVCSFATAAGSCTQDAASSMLLIPRRTDGPISTEIRQALVWPGVELATTIRACPDHREVFKRASQVVMCETPLGTETVVRKVKEVPCDSKPA